MGALDKHILVVDDEAPILDAVSYGLRKEGFRVSVAMNAEAGLRIYREQRPDLVVLDVMLPSASGFDVCRVIRQEKSTPIILLTALAGENERVSGLELGADDYMVKPFSMRELVARIQAILRRSGKGVAQGGLHVAGSLVVDEAGRTATIEGRELKLTPKEFALLSFFVANPGIAFSRETLLDRVWGPNAFVTERTVDVHVRWLREKIETDASHPRRLVTVRGLGYKLATETGPL